MSLNNSSQSKRHVALVRTQHAATGAKRRTAEKRKATTSATSATKQSQHQQCELSSVELLDLVETLLAMRSADRRAGKTNDETSGDDPIALLLDPTKRQLPDGSDATSSNDAFAPNVEFSLNDDDDNKERAIKRPRHDDNDDGVVGGETKVCDAEGEIYEKLLMRALVAIESAGAQMHFSKEALKYYLATYSGLVRPMDFVATRRSDDTNSTAVGRKKRPDTRLAPGAILYEYARSFDAFLGALERAAPNDLRALRLILTHGICLPDTFYEAARIHDPVADACYIMDELNDGGSVDIAVEEQCAAVCLSLGNCSQFKHVTVLIARNIMLVHDPQHSRQFSVPMSGPLEREIRSETLSELPVGKRYVLDVLLSGGGGCNGKFRVIDVLDDGSDRRMDYEARMSELSRVAPKLRHVERIDDAPKLRVQMENRLYIVENRASGLCERHFRPIPWLAVAAVGLHERKVLLAAIDEDDDTGEEVLRVRLRASLIGSTAIALLARPRRRAGQASLVRLDDGRVLRVVCDSPSCEAECELFADALTVELRDASGPPKIGSLARGRPVVGWRDYRLSRDSAKSTVNAIAATGAVDTLVSSPTSSSSAAQLSQATENAPTLAQMTQDVERFVDQLFCLPNRDDIVSLINTRRKLVEFD